MNYAKVIKKLRLSYQGYGMTQEQLAKKIGMSVSTIYEYENEWRIPSRDAIEKIAKALNIPTGQLVFMATEEKDLEGFDPIKTLKFLDKTRAKIARMHAATLST